MPEHVLRPEVEIDINEGRRRRWTAAEKLRRHPTDTYTCTAARTG